MTDPLGWGGSVVQAGFINAPATDDELFHLRGSLARDLDFSLLDRVEIGFDYGDRQKDRTIFQTFLTLPNGATELAIPQEAILGEQTGLFFLGFGPQVTLDTSYLVDNVYDFVSTQLSSFSTPQEWVVGEDTYTGWVKFDLDGNIGNVGVVGNLGVQIVHTDQFSTGGAVQPISGAPVIVPVSGGDAYTNVLPTLNLNFDITESFRMRIGAGRALARARLDQLSASQNLGVNINNLIQTDPLGNPGTAFSVSGGNPRLRPYLANQFDLSFENYFGGAGYVSLAFFYKDLQDFVNTGDFFLRDFTQEANNLLTPDQLAILGSPIGIERAPTNNGQGRIRGIEFTASIPLDIVTKKLDGFGFITSTSFTDSRVSLGQTTNPTAGRQIITVPGLSKWVVNSTLYFEKAGFEARLSHRFRTAFLGEVAAISATRTFRTARAESILDGQIGYAFSGALEGLRITAQGLNLTDEPFQTVQGDDRQLIDSQAFGRTFLLGGSYSF